ncbi:MAG: hypothetical protein LBG79_03715 [Spirochaetaceae bacterium]|jgi:hypothetical protein|nr:hypothetical protein [Spirochaetaceae bacterium]
MTIQKKRVIQGITKTGYGGGGGYAALTLLICLLSLAAMSCGTMKGLGKAQPVMINSTKGPVDFELYDSRGKLITSGKTPTTVVLKASKWNVAERFYLKSGDKVEVFEADFVYPVIVQDLICPAPAPLFGFIFTFGTDIGTSSLHKLLPEQEVGNVHKNAVAKLVSDVKGIGGKK